MSSSDALARLMEVYDEPEEEAIANQEKESPGFFGSLSRGIDETQGMLYGAAGLAGSAIGSESIRDWGYEGYERNVEEASKNAPTVSAKDLLSDPSKIPTWILETAGSLAPTMAEAAMGGLIGSLAMPGPGTAIGATAGRTILKKGMNKLIKKSLEKELRGKIVSKVEREALEGVLKNQILKVSLKRLGAQVGVGAAVLPMESGGNWAETLSEHGVDAPWTALATGAVATSFEFLGGNMNLVKKFLPIGTESAFKKALKAGNTSFMRRASKEILKQMPAEALQEAGQEFMSALNIAVNTDEKLFTEETAERMFESAAAGMLGGVVGGGVGGLAVVGNVGEADIDAAKRAQGTVGLTDQEKEQVFSELVDEMNGIEKPTLGEMPQKEVQPVSEVKTQLELVDSGTMQAGMNLELDRKAKESKDATLDKQNKDRERQRVINASMGAEDGERSEVQEKYNNLASQRQKDAKDKKIEDDAQDAMSKTGTEKDLLEFSSDWMAGNTKKESEPVSQKSVKAARQLMIVGSKNIEALKKAQDNLRQDSKSSKDRVESIVTDRLDAFMGERIIKLEQAEAAKEAADLATKAKIEENKDKVAALRLKTETSKAAQANATLAAKAKKDTTKVKVATDVASKKISDKVSTRTREMKESTLGKFKVDGKVKQKSQMGKTVSPTDMGVADISSYRSVTLKRTALLKKAKTQAEKDKIIEDFRPLIKNLKAKGKIKYSAKAEATEKAPTKERVKTVDKFERETHRRDIETGLNDYKKNFKDANVKVLTDPSQAPKHISDQIASDKVKPMALYDPSSNTTYVFSDNINNVTRAKFEMFHELGHHSFEELHGKAGKSILDQIAKKYPNEVQRYPVNGAEEVLIEKFLKGERSTPIVRAKSLFRKLAAKVGLAHNQITDHDINKLVKRMRDNLKNRQDTPATATATGKAKYSLPTTPEVKKLIDTPIDKLSKTQRLQIATNSFVRNSYKSRWDMSDQEVKGIKYSTKFRGAGKMLEKKATVGIDPNQYHLMKVPSIIKSLADRFDAKYLGIDDSMPKDKMGRAIHMWSLLGDNRIFRTKGYNITELRKKTDYLKAQKKAGVKQKQIKYSTKAIQKSENEFPFPPVSVTVDQLLKIDKENPEYKHWYEKTKFLSRVLDNEDDVSLIRWLAILSHTSRNKGTLSNMVEFVKARVMTKAGAEDYKGGLVDIDKVNEVLNAKNIEEMFRIGSTPSGFAEGEVKVKAFAETFASTMRNNPKMRQELQTVVDIWINRYYFPTRTDPTGTKPMALSPIQHYRIQEHMRQVEKGLSKKTGIDWTPDMAQAVMWFYTRDQWAAHGGVQQKGYTFDEALEVMAQRWSGLLEIDDKVVNAYIDQKVRDPNVRHILDRWSKSGREWVDPIYQGEGQPGKEWSKFEEDRIRPRRMHFYEAGTEPERQFRGLHRTRAVIDSDKIYDINKDPNGYRNKHLNVDRNTQEQFAAMENEIINDGFIGFQSGTVTVLFEPTRVHKMERYKLSISPMVDDNMITNAKGWDKDVANNLEQIKDLAARGEWTEIHERVESDILEAFDHPLIDVIAIRPAEGVTKQWGNEFATQVTLEAGDPVILEGAIAKILKAYSQMAGIISTTSKLVPKSTAPTTTLTFEKTLTPAEVSQVVDALDANGIGGSTYVAELNTFIVHHISKTLSKDYGITAAVFNKGISKTINDIASLNPAVEKYNFNHKMIKNNWSLNKKGEGYDKLIDKQRTHSQKLGIASSPKIVQGEKRRAGSLFRKESRFSQDPSGALKYSIAGAWRDNLSATQQTLADTIWQGSEKHNDTVDQTKQKWTDKLITNVFDAQHAQHILEKKRNVTSALSGYKAMKMLTSFPTMFKQYLYHGTPTYDPTDKWGGINQDNDGLFASLQKLKEGEVRPFMTRMLGLSGQELIGKDRSSLFGEDLEDFDTVQGLLNMTDAAYKANSKVWDEVMSDLETFNSATLDMLEAAGMIDAERRAGWERKYYIPFTRMIEDVSTGEMETIYQNAGGKDVKRVIRALKGGKREVGNPLSNLVNNYSFMLNEALVNIARTKSIDIMKDAGLANDVDSKGGVNVFKTYEGGKEKYVQVHDRVLADTIADLHGASKGKTSKFLSFPKKILTFGVTVMPAFRVANLVRDTVHTALIESSFMPFVDSYKGLMSAFRHDKTMVEFAATGAAFSGSYHTRDMGMWGGSKQKSGDKLIGDIHAKNKNIAKRWYDTWDKIGEASENAARLGLYMNLRKKGVGKLEAGYRAKDLLDFNQSGKSSLLQACVRTIPFLNARLQGMYKIGKVATDKRTRSGLLLKGAVLTMVAGMLHAMNADDDRYKELRDYERLQYLHFFDVPGAGHLRIPLPFELGAIFGSLPVYFGQWANGSVDEKQMWNVVKDTVVDTMRMDFPAYAKPFVQQWANKNMFTGGMIDSMYDKTLTPEERYNQRTSKTARGLGKLAGWSPKRIDQFVIDVFGGVGQVGLYLTDQAAMWAGEYPSDPMVTIGQRYITGVGRFAKGTAEPYSTKSQQDFYELLAESDLSNSTFNYMIKQGRGKDASEYIKKHEKSIALKGALTAYSSAARVINAQIKLVGYSTKLSPKDKQGKIDRLLIRRNRLFREAVGLRKLR